MTQRDRHAEKAQKIPPSGSVFPKKYHLAVQKIPPSGSVLGLKPASVKGGISLKVFKTFKRAFYAARPGRPQRNATPYSPHRIDRRSPATFRGILPDVQPAQGKDAGSIHYGVMGKLAHLKHMPAHVRACGISETPTKPGEDIVRLKLNCWSFCHALRKCARARARIAKLGSLKEN